MVGAVQDALYALYGGGKPSYELSERNAMMQYRARAYLAGFPVVGGILKARDNWNYMHDYMTNRGLPWSDIQYPSRTIGGVDASIGGSLNFVSNNIERLYR